MAQKTRIQLVDDITGDEIACNPTPIDKITMVWYSPDMKSEEKIKKKFSFIILAVALVAASIIAYAGYWLGYDVRSQMVQYEIGTNAYIPSSASPSHVNDQTFVDYAVELGIDISRLQISFKEMDIYQGQYFAPSTIYIDPTFDRSAQVTTLAHEYYHYVWAMLITDADRGNLQTSLDALELRDPWLSKSVESYESNACLDKCRASELHSFACTEMPNYALSQPYIEWCTKWVPNRSVIIPQ